MYASCWVLTKTENVAKTSRDGSVDLEKLEI
jgi:hypothetical protein